MNRKFNFMIAFMLLIGWNFPTAAQSIAAKNITYVKDIETVFSQGINEYRSGNFQTAKEIFLSLTTDFPIHQRITIVYLMLGKTYYKLGEYNKAISMLNKILDIYPNSNYIDDAHYAIGCCYYQMERYVPSVREFLWILDYGKDKKLIEKTRKLVFKIIELNLSVKEIENLQNETTGVAATAILNMKLAQKWAGLGNKDKAVTVLQNHLENNAPNEYSRIINELLRKIQDQQETIEVKVGVLLPLSSEFSEQAQAILTGIKYAQQTFNQNSLIQVKLIIKDTEGSIINIIRAARELVEDEKLIAIIGELESEKTASFAPIIDDAGVTLIPPVASANGLAALSKYIFQINGDLETRGIRMAEFAIKNLNLHSFATLAPADNYGKDMTDSFTATIDQLNGEIIAQKWYYENSQDMARQFNSIRELGFKRMNKDSLIEEYTRDMNPIQKAKFDDEVIPVTSIDAVFFPIYTEDIKYIVPQFAYANIKANILGGQYWYDIEELREKNIISHVDSIIFESDFYFDDISPEFHNFRTNFRKQMGKTPDEMECYGYDAMLLIAEAIKNNALTREAIQHYLTELENFEGIRGLITFKNNNRVNSEQRFITFVKGRFLLLK